MIPYGQPQPMAQARAMANFELISRAELERLAWDQGLTDSQIAELYRVTPNRVHEQRRKMNLIHGQVTSAQLKEIVLLSERIKSLPLEAIEEIKEVVGRYSH